MTKKIITGLMEILAGKEHTLRLGNTSITRDWIWAGDAAEALSAIGKAENPSDYVVGSGKSSTLYEFVALACNLLGLNAESLITHDYSLFRPSDIETISLNPGKAKIELGWVAQHSLTSIIEQLILAYPDESRQS